jgi:hypothetical protein
MGIYSNLQRYKLIDLLVTPNNHPIGIPLRICSNNVFVLKLGIIF